MRFVCSSGIEPSNKEREREIRNFDATCNPKIVQKSKQILQQILIILGFWKYPVSYTHTQQYQ